MSELCKIESPISLHLMSLNFEEKKKKETEEGREKKKKRRKRMRTPHCFGGEVNTI